MTWSAVAKGLTYRSRGHQVQPLSLKTVAGHDAKQALDDAMKARIAGYDNDDDGD